MDKKVEESRPPSAPKPAETWRARRRRLWREQRQPQAAAAKSLSLGTRIVRQPFVQSAVASLFANYLRLVNRTSRLTFDPEAAYSQYIHLAPVIFTMWHGQHFMLPFARILPFEVRVLISRHSDGEINALVAKKLGIGTIRGSTARERSGLLSKGGMAGFREMKAALDEGVCVSMTADISNFAPRRAGLGVIALAKASGRPIIPVAYASSRRIDVDSWDRATVNLPFSRAAVAVAQPVFVPTDADDALLEQRRRVLQNRLTEATERAYAIVDRRPA